MDGISYLKKRFIAWSGWGKMDDSLPAGSSGFFVVTNFKKV